MAAKSRKSPIIVRMFSMPSRKDASSVADSPLMEAMAVPRSELSSSTRLWYSSSVIGASASSAESPPSSGASPPPQAVRTKTRQRSAIRDTIRCFMNRSSSFHQNNSSIVSQYSAGINKTIHI